MEDIGLVLEGGGMRGAYTAGVLDYFHDSQIEFPFVSGASAGACNATSYVARQRGRNYKVLVEYGSHPDYISFKRALKQRELFGMDFIFDILPNQLVPFDFESFFTSNTTLTVSTTDIDTGEPVYYDSFQGNEDLLKVIRASSSLPMIAPSITYKGRNLMDGGIADPIPITPSIEAGNKKHVVVLTRNAGYVKKRMKFAWLFNHSYKQYPGLLKAMADRHERYNKAVQQLEEMERNEEVYIIRPKDPLLVGRVERKKEKLHALYLQGYKEAEAQGKQIRSFIETNIKEPLLVE
ncbi:patatin-like phospholipase family protein [Sediminibacillus albus]|uniref:Predicted phospholipase, patatin/cPLA2 family n=1 Tax=Sediminibacillus albus TaxID=407036 RepID=A0A1G8WC65_9BACI|nr:patatin family protein [Sediminibacillus albus]SDJ75848.1 Predicted phospholipase, patatin/cPLA2 family [Sediminibacillus albus]